MSKSLIVDIGNSQIEMGIFDQEVLLDKMFFETKIFKESYQEGKIAAFIKNRFDISGGIIFSVVPSLTKKLQEQIEKEIGVRIAIFNPDSILKNFKAHIDNPNEVGQDLLADIYGAIHYYGVPIIVSDLGTVTKNIIIDKDGYFEGVSFFPGLQTNASVLASNTAQLPLIDNLEKPKLFYGKNTIDAMSSGIYYCHVAAIKGFMNKADEYFGYKFKKVITGGFANLFKDDFPKEKYIVDQTLVLKGMNLIYLNSKE